MPRRTDGPPTVGFTISGGDDYAKRQFDSMAIFIYRRHKPAAKSYRCECCLQFADSQLELFCILTTPITILPLWGYTEVYRSMDIASASPTGQISNFSQTITVNAQLYCQSKQELCKYRRFYICTNASFHQNPVFTAITPCGVKMPILEALCHGQ